MLGATFSRPHSPPTPHLANYSAPTATLTVLWSTALKASPLSPLNWSMRFNNSAWTFSAASAHGKYTTATGAMIGALDPGPNVCNYAAAPADVLSSVGLPAPPFANFPIL